MLLIIIHRSLAHWHILVFGVLAVTHLVKGSCLAHLSSLHSASCEIVLTFGLSSRLSIDHLLLVVVNTTLVIPVKLRSPLVILFDMVVKVIARALRCGHLDVVHIDVIVDIGLIRVISLR